MAINRLIALGGRGVKSPVERFIETKGQMERGRLRQVQERAGNQNIDINRRREGRDARQDRVNQIAPYAKAVLTADPDERQQVYEQAKQQLTAMGIDMSQAPQAPDMANMAAVMEAGGLELDEKFTEIYKNGQPVSQKSSKSGRFVTHPEAPSKVIQGTPEEFSIGDKDLVKLTEKRRINEQTLYKSTHATNRLEKLVSSDQFIGGIAGDAVSMINSLTSQVEQMVGLDSIVDENNNIRESEIDPSSKQFSSLRKKAIQNDAYSAALIEMAYVKAKLVDPASKITDKDFDFARKMLASGADKASIINTLRMQKKHSQENYNQEEKTAKGRFERYVPSLYSDEKYRDLYNVSPPIQLDESSSPDDFARDWLQGH